MTTIEVIRGRQSSNIGYAHVIINDTLVASHMDFLVPVKSSDGPFYSEEIDGYASVIPDSSFILLHPHGLSSHYHNDVRNALTQGDVQIKQEK